MVYLATLPVVLLASSDAMISELWIEKDVIETTMD
jgi:hypothetical protein